MRDLVTSDTSRMESLIQPEYKKIETQIQTNVLKLTSGYENVKKQIVTNGEIWHKAVESAVKKCLERVETMEKEDFSNLREQRKLISSLITEIQSLIDYNKKILNENDISEINKFKAKSEEFSRIPTITSIIAPVFKNSDVEKEQLPERFGALKASVLKKSRDFVINVTSAEPPSKRDTLLDKPVVLRKVETKFEKCWSVQCIQDQNVWISGDVETVAKDVCVSDRNAKAVVSTTQSGRFRWRYFGNVPTRKCPYFDPRSILTDRSCRILVSDADSNLVHLLDDRGHLLCLIGRGFLEKPVGISLDSEGNLYVVEYHTAKLKVIKYIK
uniref:Tripartite motif-containing protein 2 n=1 Tax=Magallana gigas TaxID=29159 RepID=A0A8W8LQR2_MAGGI